MIYPHQQAAIDYITEKMKKDADIQALLISGSIAHGYNTQKSDVDINMIVSNEIYKEKVAKNEHVYWESGEQFYKGGYFDGKFICTEYLDLLLEKGNEPTLFALHDVKIAFDKTGEIQGYIDKLSTYTEQRKEDNKSKFVPHLDCWFWFCGEALASGNEYLLQTAVSRLILFAGRLILAENKKFFPYHKWLIRCLEECEIKPDGFDMALKKMLAEKNEKNINDFYKMVREFRQWHPDKEFSWPPYVVHDVETLWMRDCEFIENM